MGKIIKIFSFFMLGLILFSACQPSYNPPLVADGRNEDMSATSTMIAAISQESETSAISEGHVVVTPPVMNTPRIMQYTAIPAQTVVVGTPVETGNNEMPLTYCEHYGFMIFEELQKQGAVFIGGGGGGGNENECVINFDGLKNVEDFTILSKVVNKVFGSEDWKEDIQAAAGGPIGQVVGFKNENSRCVFRYEWQLPKDGRCPTDRPVGDCDILQKDKVYLLSLACRNVTEDMVTPTP